MAKYIAFENPDGTRVLVEVDETEAKPVPGATIKAGLSDRIDGAVRQAASTLKDALSSVIRNNAQAFYNAVQEVSPPPTDAEITLTLKATGELGNVAVGKVGGEGNYSVKLTWKSTPTVMTEDVR